LALIAVSAAIADIVDMDDLTALIGAIAAMEVMGMVQDQIGLGGVQVIREATAPMIEIVIGMIASGIIAIEIMCVTAIEPIVIEMIETVCGIAATHLLFLLSEWTGMAG
jgi:hypothetical protein